MYHFALAGNMLTAIGGVPSIANAAFIPSYPTNVLPGEILQKLPVDLKPLTPDQVQVFMQIEYPEFPPVALAARTGPATIGDFYDAIAEGFTTVNPAINASAFAVNSGEATPIKSIADAQAAILLIKAEGEGTEGSPNQPPNAGAGCGWPLELYGSTDPVSDLVRFSAIDHHTESVACVQSGPVAALDRPSNVLDKRYKTQHRRHVHTSVAWHGPHPAGHSS
jgi:hypothetical protein